MTWLGYNSNNNFISAPTPFRDFQRGYTTRVYRYVSVRNRELRECDLPAKRIDTHRNILFKNLTDFYIIGTI